MGVLLFRKAFRDGVSRDLPLARLFDRERGFRRSTAPRGEPNSLEPGLYQCTAPAVGCLLGKLSGIFYQAARLKPFLRLLRTYFLFNI